MPAVVQASQTTLGVYKQYTRQFRYKSLGWSLRDLRLNCLVYYTHKHPWGVVYLLCILICSRSNWSKSWPFSKWKLQLNYVYSLIWVDFEIFASEVLGETTISLWFQLWQAVQDSTFLRHNSTKLQGKLHTRCQSLRWWKHKLATKAGYLYCSTCAKSPLNGAWRH